MSETDKAVAQILKLRLVNIHDALSAHIGDTDPDLPEDMTDDEVREYEPVFWAAKEIADLIGDAPWSDYTRQQVIDDLVQRSGKIPTASHAFGCDKEAKYNTAPCSKWCGRKECPTDDPAKAVADSAMRAYWEACVGDGYDYNGRMMAEAQGYRSAFLAGYMKHRADSGDEVREAIASMQAKLEKEQAAHVLSLQQLFDNLAHATKRMEQAESRVEQLEKDAEQRKKMPVPEWPQGEYPSNASYAEGYAEGWNAAIDAAMKGASK
jgi:hypothetical protein